MQQIAGNHQLIVQPSLPIGRDPLVYRKAEESRALGESALNGG